jgi:hypothetical protein
MKAKILRDDPSRRFKAGEIGEVVKNDFPEKYDYLIKLSGTVRIDNFLGCGVTDTIRKYYFYADEIELIEEER